MSSTRLLYLNGKFAHVHVCILEVAYVCMYALVTVCCKPGRNNGQHINLNILSDLSHLSLPGIIDLLFWSQAEIQ